MPTDLRVPIPPRVEDLRLYFDEMVENDGFGLALAYSVAEFDELAQLTDLAVTGGQATDTGVDIVSWEAFHACDDKTVGAEHARVVRSRKDGTDWVFEPANTPGSRSTFDEF